MATLSRDQVKGIIQGAPSGSKPAEIVKGLIDRGYTLDGYNPSATNQTPITAPKVDTPPPPPDAPDTHLLSRLGQDYNQRQSNLQPVIHAQNPLRGAAHFVENVGQGAGFLGDVIGEGVKSTLGTAEKGIEAITPKSWQKPLTAAGSQTGDVMNSIGGKLIAPEVKEVSSYLNQNPEEKRLIGAASNIASLIPDAKGIETGLETAGNTFAKMQVKRDVNAVDKLVGSVIQGKTKDIPKATKALSSIDTTQVKTYKDLHQTVDNKIKTIQSRLDQHLESKPEKKLLNDLTVSTKVGNETVTHNFVDDSLKQLEELYTKTNDPVGAARIKQLQEKATKEGLSALEVNNLAKEHGTEFGQKAFSKTGDPLTSVNAQAFENTRKGIKGTARQLFGDPSFEAADKEVTNLIRLSDLAKTMEEKVNQLTQKIQPRSIGQKVGRFAFQVADIASLGTFKGFVAAAIPRGQGLKVLNALDLEKALERNLSRIQKALEATK